MSKRKRFIFPGTFDPFTIGHLDLAVRAASLCDELIVAVLNNINKRTAFTLEERVRMAGRCLAAYDTIVVKGYEGLIADFYRQEEATCVVRGIRSESDFGSEFVMSAANRRLDPNFETCFLPARSEFSFMSSSVVREIATFGGDISTMVPMEIVEEVRQRMRADSMSKNGG